MAKRKQNYRVNFGRFAAFVMALCLLIAGACYVLGNSGNAAAESALGFFKGTDGGKLTGRKIVVDAGHGGFYQGSTGYAGSHEDELNLAVANYLKSELENAGAEVIMTRSDSNAIAETKLLDMQKRRDIISSSGADIAISIHMNSYTNSTPSGPLTMFAAGSVKGEALAGAVQARLIEDLKPQSENNTRGEDFYILESGNMPCIIVECGFISNPQEEALLIKPSYQRQVAQSIRLGVEDYFLSSEQ